MFILSATADHLSRRGEATDKEADKNVCSTVESRSRSEGTVCPASLCPLLRASVSPWLILLLTDIWDAHTSRQPESKPERAMHVTINGAVHTLDEGLTIAQLLVQLGKNPKLLAVERNYELVPRAQHAERPLTEGDVLEIVTLVGGG